MVGFTVKAEAVLDLIEDAVAAIARGEIVVVVDDESRENEGDLVMAAEFATPEAISFMVRQAAGMLCVAIPEARADELALPLMVSELLDPHRTAFALSVDVVHGLTTGISPEERASTCRALAHPRAVAADFLRPGHVNVLRGRHGGVLQRSGLTEAAVDLARLAGVSAAGVICEVLSEDGVGMARRPELERFAAAHGLMMISIADLIAWMREQGRGLIRRTGTGRVPTEEGDFTCHAYESAVDGLTHLALVYGDLDSVEAPLVRVHSECPTGDIFRSRRCDCGEQLQSAMRVIAEATSSFRPRSTSTSRARSSAYSPQHDSFSHSAAGAGSSTIPARQARWPGRCGRRTAPRRPASSP